MAEGTRSTKRASSPSWLASLMGAVFLISAGFMLGLIVGVVKEEPDLVIGHLGGQSEEVEWSEQGTAVPMPDVAAPGPDFGFADGAETADYIAETEIEESAELDSEFDAGWDPADDFGIEAPSSAAEDQVSRAYEAPQPAATVAPVREAAPAVEQAASNRGAGGFSVQVGAFAESDSAARTAADLRIKGFTVYVTPSAGSRDGRWRVRVGPMATRAEADDVAQQLKTRHQLPTWVVTE
jgi:cell division septation protein DedD